MSKYKVGQKVYIPRTIYRDSREYLFGEIKAVKTTEIKREKNGWFCGEVLKENSTSYIVEVDVEQQIAEPGQRGAVFTGRTYNETRNYEVKEADIYEAV